MKKKVPTFKSDEEAERFVATVDLSKYDLSGLKPLRFEFKKKSAQLNMRGKRHTRHIGSSLNEFLKKEGICGSGNVYRDFNVPDADVRQFKAILAVEIIMMLDKKGLSVRKAQSLTGVPAADLSRIRNADLERFTSDRMMMILNKLGSRVEVSVRVKERKLETVHA